MTDPTPPLELTPEMLAGAIVCYTRCWSCQFGQHFDPPEAHTWMDEEDTAHAIATGQASRPDNTRCGCACAKTPAAGRSDFPSTES